MRNPQHLITAILMMAVTTIAVFITMVFIPPTKTGFAIVCLIGATGYYIAINELGKYFV